MKRSRALIAVLVALATVAACSGDDDSESASTAGTTDAVPGAEAVTTATGSTTSTSTPSTTSPDTSTPPRVSTTTIVATSTTTGATLPPTDDCDTDEILLVIDDTIERARLTTGGEWEPADDRNPFIERTNTAEEFADRLAFDCAAELQQITTGGDERLVLAAWNDVRHAHVIQATDGPATPYALDAVFQLFLEQPYGEWIDEQFIWSATMSGGESIVIGTDDYSIGLTAKSWQAAVPPFEDLPVTNDAERHAIDVLLAAGGRNVSVAEPAAAGSPMASIQANTPDALLVVATIAPVEMFDPSVPVVDEETTFRTHDGIEIRASRGLELESELIDVGWSCDDYGWRLTTGLGTTDEVVAFATQIIDAHDC